MVDGVHGDIESVVRHVVVEYRTIPGYAMLLNLHAQGKNVKVSVTTLLNVMTFAVQVRK